MKNKYHRNFNNSFTHVKKIQFNAMQQKEIKHINPIKYQKQLKYLSRENLRLINGYRSTDLRNNIEKK